MTRARMAWRVNGEVDPSSLRIEDNVISCAIEIPDDDVLEVKYGSDRLLVNYKAKTIQLNDLSIELGPIPFSVLAELSRDPRKFFSAAELYKDVWGGDLSKVSTRSVDAAVSVVRKQMPLGWVINKVGTGWRLLPWSK